METIRLQKTGDPRSGKICWVPGIEGRRTHMEQNGDDKTTNME